MRRHILCNGEAHLHGLTLVYLFSVLVTLVLQRHTYARSVELGSDSHLLRERCALVVETRNLSCGSVVLSPHAFVLILQILIKTVERVNFKHIATQHGTHCSEFFLQSRDFAGVRTLHLSQFFEQLLSLLLLRSKLRHDRVVGYLRLHLAVLVGELLIFVLHFLLVKLSQFLHFTVLLLLFVKTNSEERDACHE